MNPTLCGLLALLMFGWGSVLVVFCLQVMPSFQLGFTIFLIGYIAFSLLELARGHSLITPWKQDWKSYAGTLSGVGLYTLLMYTAFRTGPPFEMNVLNYLWPIFVVLFSMLLGQMAVTPFQVAGLVLGFLGMLMLFITPDHAGSFMANIGSAHILAVTGAAVWAGYCVWAKGKHYPSAFMGPIMLLSGLMCLPGHLLLEETVFPHSLTGLVLVFLLGLFRVSYVLWDIGMRRGDTLLLSSLSYFVPLVSTLLMVAFGFRPEHSGIALGGAFIISGCLVVNAPKIAKLFVRKAGAPA
jgi:drug/metabolite transporter (DMT)-like permease